MLDKNKVFFTTHPVSDREKKNLLFLNLIKKHASISRAEIVKLTDITAVTVSNYVNGYLKKGIVLERGYDISSGGRRPELVEINKEWGCAGGIDIDENSTKGILINLGGEILAAESFGPCGIGNLISFMSEISEKLVKSAKVDKALLKKIGISVQAGSGDIRESAISAKDEIEGQTGVPLLIGNAALCGAYGEKVLNGGAKETSKMLYIRKDIGEGIFIEGDQFHEADDEENEYAYLREWNEDLSVVSEAKKIIKKGVGTKIVDLADGEVDSVGLSDIIKAAQGEDELAVDLIKSAAMNLSVRIAYLINSLKPEAVVIGGGIEKAGGSFLKPLESSVSRFISQDLVNKVKLIPGALGEDACVKGAALLAIREVFIEA